MKRIALLVLFCIAPLPATPHAILYQFPDVPCLSPAPSLPVGREGAEAVVLAEQMESGRPPPSVPRQMIQSKSRLI
jgi:hypothetical protein